MMNQVLHSQKKRIFSWAVLLIIAAVTFFSCSKEGTLETVPEFTRVTFDVKSLKQAPVMYEVKVGDYIVDDSVTIYSSVTSAIERSSAEQRLKITERNSNTILLDTMIVIPPADARYTIYQIDTAEGTKPLFVVGGQGDAVPVDTFMQAYYVNDPIFPDVFDIKLWELQADGTGKLIYTFKDVRKGQFTEFIPLAIQGVYILDPVKSDGQPIDPNILPVDPNDPRSGGLSEARCSSTNNHQISKFSALDFGGGFILYYMECMFQY